MGDYQFTAYWKLWTPDGVQVSFGVAKDDPDEHLNTLAAYMDTLRALGYVAAPPTLDDGEKVEAVDAYVLGKTSKDDACIYLYSASHQLQYRLATVYVERFPDLPFNVNTSKRWPAAAAPTREEAEKNGYLFPVSTFEIVMELKGKTEDGKEQWRFARIHGTPKPAPAQPHVNADRELAAIPGASDALAKQHAAAVQAAEAVRAKLQQMAAGYNGAGKQPAADEEKGKAAANLGLLARGEDARHALTGWLFGKPSLNDLTSGEVRAIRDWVHVTKQGGEWLPSQQAIDDAKAVFAALNGQK